MINRRTFLAGTGAVLLTTPLAAKAQRAGKVYRVGWLATFTEPRITFRDAMRELGYVEGKTAKALGLTIPPSLLGRADEVIQ